jgi:hypothetical protein
MSMAAPYSDHKLIVSLMEPYNFIMAAPYSDHKLMASLTRPNGSVGPCSDLSNMATFLLYGHQKLADGLPDLLNTMQTYSCLGNCWQ